VVRLHYLHRMLQKELQRIAQKTAVQANKKRSEGPDFQEGEMVYLLRKNIKTKRPSNKLDHTKLGPYKIKRKKGPVSFELDLPKTMRIHPTFHKSLLEACHNPEARPGQVTVDPEIQEPEYEVEEIKANKVRKGQPYYLIKWKGYDESENTWEPIENIPRNLVRQFHKEEGPPDSGHRDFFIVDEILSHRNTKNNTQYRISTRCLLLSTTRDKTTITRKPRQDGVPVDGISRRDASPNEIRFRKSHLIRCRQPVESA